MSATVNLAFDKGDLEVFQGTVTDQDGFAVDIQGATLEFGVKKHVTDVLYVLFKSTGGNGITILDDGTPDERGKYEVSVLPSDTADLMAGIYQYSMRTIYGPEDTHTIVRGNVIITEDVVDST